MYGYIYLTRNNINGRVYVGKHKSNKYDKGYIGSGKVLKKAIEKYSKENFRNIILDTADSLEELNNKERHYIKLISPFCGELMYNIADGGDGGDTTSKLTKEGRAAFVQKMTKINKQRCSTDAFRKKCSKRMTEKYLNPDERGKQAIKIKKAWSDEVLREKQSRILKEYYKTHKKDNSYNCKKCIFELEDIYEEFNSVKELKRFLKDEYGYSPGNSSLKQYLTDGTGGKTFEPFHKNKYKKLKGAKLYYKQNENVETMGDECSPVGDEIGTSSKRETEIEEIVRSS